MAPRSSVRALVLATAFVLAGCRDATTLDGDAAASSGPLGLSSSCRELRVGDLEVTPRAAEISVGGTKQLTVVARDRQGRIVSDPDLCWVSRDPSIAKVSANGLVTGVKPGLVLVVASVDRLLTTERAGALIKVTGTAPIATLEIQPSVSNLVLKESIQLSVVARDANGNGVPSGSVTWQSSNPVRATLSSAGLLTGVKSSLAHSVTATAGGVSTSIQFPVIPLVVLQYAPNVNGGVTSTNPIVGLGLDGTIAETITDCTAGELCGDEHPSFSPSGLAIVFRRMVPGTLMTVNVDGTNLASVFGGLGSMQGAAWGANGLIAFTRVVMASPSACSDQDIFTITTAGANLQNITNSPCASPPNAASATEQWPVWSPTNRLYFARDVTNDGYNIFAANANGSGVTQITTGIHGGFEADVSRDGSKLVVRRTSPTFPVLWIMNADGSGQEQITFGNENPGRARWSGPRTVVFCSGGGPSGYRFYQVDVITKQISVLWDTPCYNYSWNPLRK